jgi:hypothetical protein
MKNLTIKRTKKQRRIALKNIKAIRARLKLGGAK